MIEYEQNDITLYICLQKLLKVCLCLRVNGQMEGVQMECSGRETKARRN